MDKKGKIKFRFEANVDGEEITPENIGFGEFLALTKDVGDFIRGSGSSSLLDQAHVEFEEGSFIVNVFLSATLLAGVMADYKVLEQGEIISGVDRGRSEILEKWQRKAKKDPSFKVSILPAKDTSLNSIRISAESDFRKDDKDLWVRVDRYVIGRIFSQGGKNKPNIHLTIDHTDKDLILDTTQEFLSSRQISMYQTVTVHIETLENIVTHELKNSRLIDILGAGPSYDEDELNNFINKGTAAWRDVVDLSKWLAEQRGREA